MKRTLLFFWFLFVVTEIFSQVGINTTNPQRGFHVAGGTENVRVEGLSYISPTFYNSENLGAAATSKVYVNASGDLVLGNTGDTSLSLVVDTDNYLNNVEDPTNIVIQTGVNFGYNTAGIPTDGIVGASFTLTQNAVLEINYSVSWSIYDANSQDKKRLDDVRARVIQTGIYFIDTATEIPIINDLDGIPINGGPWCIDTNASGNGCLEYGGLLALTGQFYNNASQVRGSYKNMRNTASDYVKLGPGTYTALFAARVQVEVITGGGAAKMHLGSGNDSLQIIAYYYD